MRGLWLGYQAGFYKGIKKDALNCLNQDTTQNIEKMLDFFERDVPDFSQTFTIINEGMKVMANIEANCRVEDSIDDLVKFCDANPNSCTGANVL